MLLLQHIAINQLSQFNQFDQSINISLRDSNSLTIQKFENYSADVINRATLKDKQIHEPSAVPFPLIQLQMAIAFCYNQFDCSHIYKPH